MKKILLILLLVAINIGIYLFFTREDKTTKGNKPAQEQEQTLITGTSSLATATVSFTKPASGTSIWVPVLVYHRIAVAPPNASSVYKSLTIEPEWFEKHLQYLRDNGFYTVHFSDVAEYFAAGKPLPERPVMINFDDGYKDFYTNALPILKKYKMTGTLFMIAGSIGYPAYLTLDQLKEVRDAGIEIGAHSMSHPYLTKSKNAKEEITKAKKVLEEKLGISITTFAYPYGDWDANMENLLKEAGYSTGRSFTTGNGISEENLFHIPVVRVYANVGLERWKNQLFPD